MFIADGYGTDVPQGNQLELVTRYHKGYNVSGKTKVIHRFLPREVGALLIWAVWLVRSAWDTLQHIRSEGEHQQSWQIWHADAAGREWISARINREMKQASEEACGEGLTILSWRDISIAASRKYLRKGEGRFHHDEEDWDNEKDEDEVKDKYLQQLKLLRRLTASSSKFSCINQAQLFWRVLFRFPPFSDKLVVFCKLEALPPASPHY